MAALLVPHELRILAHLSGWLEVVSSVCVPAWRACGLERMAAGTTPSRRPALKHTVSYTQIIFGSPESRLAYSVDSLEAKARVLVAELCQSPMSVSNLVDAADEIRIELEELDHARTAANKTDAPKDAR